MVGGWFILKMPAYQYRNSHCEDKTIPRHSCHQNRISFSGKTESLKWIFNFERNVTLIQSDSSVYFDILVSNKNNTHTNNDREKTTKYTQFENLIIEVFEVSIKGARKRRTRHESTSNAMMKSSNGDIFHVTGPLWGGMHRSPVDSPH